ncbi:MAG: hypothetical protein ABWZ25_15635 [Chitinophagaceae bacterium]
MITINLVLSGLILVFLVVKETLRPQRRNLPWRLLACGLVITALAFLVIPLNWQGKTTMNKEEIRLLTDGASVNPVGNKNIQAFTTSPTLASNQIKFIPDLSVFLSSHTGIDLINVEGYGLPLSDLDLLRQHRIPVTYQPTLIPAGFNHSVWPRQIRLNENFGVQGNFHNPDGLKIKIRLEGPGIGFDSTLVSDSAEQPFQLQFQPVFTGTVVLELKAIATNGKEWTEKIPVDILPAKNLQVLMLSSSPDFETKFISSWLYNNHQKVAVRSTLGPLKYSSGFLNKKNESLDQVTTGLLSNYDLVIADDEALSSLSPAERVALRIQVTQGLGLIIQADSTRLLSELATTFRISRNGHNQGRSLLINGKIATLTPAVVYQIAADQSLLPLITDTRQSIVAAARLYGSGRIVLNSITDTYTWILNGQKREFESYWTTLINNVTRRTGSPGRWTSNMPFPVVSQPMDITLQSAADSIPVIRSDDENIYLTQNRWLRDSWTGTWWPVNKGWQTLSSGDSCKLYIYDQGDWLVARTASLISTNQFYAAEKSATGNVGQPTIVTVTRSVSKIFVFIVLLASISYLWFEGKRNRV